MQHTTLASIRPHSETLGRDRVGARAAAYCALAAGLLLLYLAIRDSSWAVTPSLHLAFELTAAVVALIVGILALVRFYSRKNDTLLLIGAAMIGTSVLDTYHLLVTTGIPMWLMPADHEATEPWSWFGSRMFLSVLLLWSWTAWRRENRQGVQRLSELRIYLEVGAITVLSIALFGMVSLPDAIRTGAIVPRPFELLPGAFFAVATIGYLAKGNWRNRPFEVWLVPALLVSVAIQWLFMPFSVSPFDAFATVSAVLKLLSYGYILIGLVASMYGLYRQLERSALLIEHSHEALRGESVDRKAAVAAASTSEEKYRTILATIQEGYFELDLAGNFVFWNEALMSLLGYRAERMAGLNYRAYTGEAHSTAVFEMFSRVYRTGQPVEAFAWEIIRPDGTHRYAEASAGPIRGEQDEIIGFRGIVRDVTARRHAEELVEAKSRELARTNEELRQFAYVASHDLQEPLRMVASYTQLLAHRYEGRLDGEADLFIRHTIEGVTRMQHLIGDLRDYSRVQSDARTFETVSLDTALEGALADLREKIEEADATITVDPLPEVEADPTQMEQLLQNLIGNAIKFRGELPVEVHIGAHKRPGEWQVFVCDNGIGVDPMYRERVFDIFHRVHGRRKFEGTGIGLAICKRIVERHGGRIWAEPTPGRGATLVFTLPRPRGVNPTAEETAASPVETAPPPASSDVARQPKAHELPVVLSGGGPGGDSKPGHNDVVLGHERRGPTGLSWGEAEESFPA